MPLQDLVEPVGYTVERQAADRHSRYRFTLRRDGDTVGTGTHFTGTGTIPPWIELHLDTGVDPFNTRHRELFDALTAALAPGGHVMVHYLGTDTSEALTADVPPPATPLGFLLWNAGCRWFKDWYFTEGWMEGSQKLQGNLPVDETTRQEREAETRQELQDFVDSATDFEQCKKLADEVLDTL
ncbi:MAG: DUF1122 family protein [Candidatus Nanohaloarchaea archaeon]|nr:DUF1122 family protein [Candidatus Nanohaloarchaea archaeon]